MNPSGSSRMGSSERSRVRPWTPSCSQPLTHAHLDTLPLAPNTHSHCRSYKDRRRCLCPILAHSDVFCSQGRPAAW